MDFKRAPHTVYSQRTGGVDITTISLRPAEYADACEPAGCFVDGLEILAKYKVDHARITFAAGERNALIFFDCNADTNFDQLLEDTWPAGWFFQGSSGQFLLSETLNELPVVQDKIYQNVFGTCIRRQDLAYISPKTLRTNQFAHDIVLTIETFPKTATLEVSIAATPCPPLPCLVKTSESGSSLRILDENGLVRADIPGPEGTYVFRDYDIGPGSVHTAYEMLYPTKEVPAPTEDSSTVLFHNVYLDNIAPWEVLDVSTWTKAVEICVTHFQDKSGLKLQTYIAGVHRQEDYGGRSFQSTTKRIDGQSYTIFSVDLTAIEKTETFYRDYVYGMKTLLEFFKTVSFEVAALHDLDVYMKKTSKPKRHLVDDDNSEDDAPPVVRQKKRKVHDKDSYISDLKKRFKTFGRVGGRGGVKRGEDFLRRRREALDENVDKEKESALKHMSEDEFATLIDDLTDAYGYA